MKLRFFSAFIAILIIVPLVWFAGPYPFYIITFLLMLGSAIEYKNMVLKNKYKDLAIFFLSFSVMLFVRFLYFPNAFFTFFLTIILLFWLYSILRFSVFYKETDDNKQIFSIISALSIGLLYVPITMAFVAKIRDLNNGILMLTFFLTLVWIGDSAAYFVGRFLGKKKLSPGLSPNKSIEGSIGALLFAVLVAFLFKLFFIKNLSLLDAFILGVISNFFGQLGDLFESLLKRNFNIKDSGTFLPGHGGFLDRFDGVMFAAPFFYYYVVNFC